MTLSVVVGLLLGLSGGCSLLVRFGLLLRFGMFVCPPRGRGGLQVSLMLHFLVLCKLPFFIFLALAFFLCPDGRAVLRVHMAMPFVVLLCASFSSIRPTETQRAMA